MGAARPAENGFSVRQPVMKGAAIIDRVESCEIRCFIRDMDAQGAEISVGSEVGLPPEFLLYVPHKGVVYRASLRWREGARAEVEFSGTEPKPHWHYG
jgi:hypothetical protein